MYTENELELFHLGEEQREERWLEDLRCVCPQ